jgi:predicted nuclease with TOPRIM domain
METSMDLSERLTKATKRREDCAAKKQRIQGLYEAAQTNLAGVEDEIRLKKIEPDQLADAKAKLETRYETLIAQIEKEVEAAEQALAPFSKE